jgi:hypothetical protein
MGQHRRAKAVKSQETTKNPQSPFTSNRLPGLEKSRLAHHHGHAVGWL